MSFKYHPKYWEFHKEEFNNHLGDLDSDVAIQVLQDTDSEEHDILLKKVEEAVIKRIKKN